MHLLCGAVEATSIKQIGKERSQTPPFFVDSRTKNEKANHAEYNG